MTNFYLVRHAHPNWIPDENRPLSESGLSEAQRVADLLPEYPINTIYASPYYRARQTVEPVAQRLNLPIHTLNDLRERLLAAETPEPVENFRKAVEAVWRDPNFSHPGGESNVVAQKRGVALIEQLTQQHPEDHVVLATHGNLMALILQHFDPTLGYEFWKALTMPDVYRLTLGEGLSITRLWQESAST